jgi:hypothetical protein
MQEHRLAESFMHEEGVVGEGPLRGRVTYAIINFHFMYFQESKKLGSYLFID